MGDLPRMAIQVDEHAGVAAPEGLGARSRDRRAGPFGLLEDGIHLRGRADVVGERDAAPSARIVDRAVLRERVAAPQCHDHAAGREERDPVGRVGGASPAEGLVEGAGAPEVGDAEGDQAQPLFHRPPFGSRGPGRIRTRDTRVKSPLL